MKFKSKRSAFVGMKTFFKIMKCLFLDFLESCSMRAPDFWNHDGRTARLLSPLSALWAWNVRRRLESGEAPLDESIDLYARGDALRAHCQKRLDAAQARIEAIVSDGGSPGRAVGTKPFDDAGGA